MVNVAYCQIAIYLPGNQSLKGKRQVLRSLNDRVRHRFNVAIAELDSNNLWQHATLGVCCVNSSPGGAARILDQVNRFIDEELVGKANVMEIQTGIVSGFF